MRKITYEELIARVSERERPAVDHWWKSPGTSALVWFEDRERGDASVVAVGPKRHVKRVKDVVGSHLNELPELRQYPRYYCEKDIPDPGH